KTVAKNAEPWHLAQALNLRDVIPNVCWCPIIRDFKMQTQPPDKNNPSNPLYKVAALTLDKEHVDIPDSRATVRILATLTFKRSSDLRGKTKTSTGHDVTVCFSLAIRRASFELTAFF